MELFQSLALGPPIALRLCSPRGAGSVAALIWQLLCIFVGVERSATLVRIE